MAFEEAFKAQQENYKENYSEMIRMFPVSSLPKDKSDTGGPFDRAIEKGVKAIKTHSIQTKPEKRQGKRNDPKYQEWMNRTEYNPFLHNAWILMAKAQFHNGDFMQAASSFAYIARLYASQPEIALNAKIWQARCYAEIDWFYEADDILSKIKKENLSKRLQDWYATVQADFLIKQKQYSEAVPYLKTAIRAEKDKLQKNRQKFLLGQIYGSLGEKSLAYKMFGEIASSSVTYPLMFGAKVRQTEVYAGNDTAKITGELRKMARSSKNKEYLDQIYYALGNVYMTIPDTAKAIASYELGVEKSTQKGIDKALNQIKLGDIYFERRKYVQAQPNYSEALTQLKKGDDAYPRVSKRSEILDELVNHIEAVELQDSLLRLSQMSEDEQMEVINQIIANLKKKEAEEKKKQEREDYLAQQEDLRAELNTNRPRPVAPVMPPSDEGLFYFYSPQVVALGKNTFQQKWGRRKLEDDWRRRNKNNPMQDIFDDEDRAEMEKKIPDTKMETGENMSSAEKMAETSSDPHDPQFYLQQIPASEEDIEEANLIIANGLFNMALIYKDLLEDIPLALETFDQLISRFPENENKLLAYYHIFLIYLKEENTDMTRRYKQIIRAEFPESEYAIAMADPNYEYNLRMMNVVQDSLYRDTYQAYLEGNVDAIRTNYQIVTTKYNQSKLLPKFSFLNALSYVQTNDADKFKELLKELINKFPKADVSVLAAEMMKGFQRGLLLSASGDNLLARGNLFNIRFGASEGELSEDIAALEFSMETDTPYELLLMYPQGAVNDNLLLYMVAHFNFGNFVINDFDLEKTSSDKIGMLHIKGFNNFDEILQYLRIIDSPEGYASKLEQPVVIVPVSLENYDILMRGKSLEEYMTFFEKNFGENYPSLIERWNLNREETFEPLAGELDTAVSDDELSEEKTMETTEIQPIPPVTVLSEQGTAAVPSPAVSEEDQQKTSEWEEKISSTYDQASGVVEDINTTLNEILSDPIRGIQNLFKRKKSSNAIDEYAKQQEKEEKERQKQLKKEKEEKDKALQEQARQKEKEKQELLKRQQEEEKNLLKEKKKQEEELVKQKKQEEKAKEDEKKRIQKEKEDARKQKEKERKEIQKKKEQERKAKEKAREEARKQKEKERKEIQKKKEQERKAKANARKKQSR
jgi:tetratricopeptide (TPR) repeat protein